MQKNKNRIFIMVSNENLYLESILVFMPFFSVIIPLYNKEKFIQNTLNSVLNQTFADFELIIVNDGSTDNSQEKVLAFKDPRIQYYSKENEGASGARNFGIEKAKSDYITFIDADDFWYPSFLSEMHSNINAFPEQKVFAAAIEIETSDNVIPAKYSIEKTDECQVVNYFDSSSKMTVICTSCAAFHKSIFEEIGNFDINIRSGQDTDLWIRIGLKKPVVFSSKILARYVHDDKSLSKQPEYFSTKIDYSKFAEAEKTNPKLRKFLDYNRFSSAIKCKITGDQQNFELFYKAIDLKNLTKKKIILLQLPSVILKALLNLNSLLVRMGLSNSVFR